MHSKDIVINCPFCLADLQYNRFARSMQCPFCDKKFNVEDGEKTREILMQKKFAEEEKTSIEPSDQNTKDATSAGKAKYCTECGRKLVYDARFCDWCGTRIKI